MKLSLSLITFVCVLGLTSVQSQKECVLVNNPCWGNNGKCCQGLKCVGKKNARMCTEKTPKQCVAEGSMCSKGKGKEKCCSGLKCDGSTCIKKTELPCVDKDNECGKGKGICCQDKGQSLRCTKEKGSKLGKCMEKTVPACVLQGEECSKKSKCCNSKNTLRLRCEEGTCKDVPCKDEGTACTKKDDCCKALKCDRRTKSCVSKA